MNRKIIFLVIILFSIFFRFYRLNDFQYWSVDEGIIYLEARKIFIEHKPILLVPNTTIEISLGPLFAYISAFIYWFTNSNLYLILSLGSLFGVITSLMIYKTGKLLFNERVGLIVCFLYSCSFLISLFDRRWWDLSLNFLLVNLAIIALYKIIEGKYTYALLLVFAASFAWNADPSLLVIALAAIFCFIFLKIPLWRYQFLPALFWLIISFSSFFLAEARHPQSVSWPLARYLSRIFSVKIIKFNFFFLKEVSDILNNFNRPLFTLPSKHIDDYFFCLPQYYPPNWFDPFSTIISFFIFFIPVFWIFKKIKRKLKINIIILYIFIGTFFFSALFFKLLTGVEITLSYFLVIWPIFLLLIAAGLEFLLKKNLWPVVYCFLMIFFCLNLYSLFLSKMNYPLKIKLEVMETVIKNLKEEPFALFYEGKRYGFFGGGWETLFTIKGRSPAWSPIADMTKWVYQFYSLYPTKPEEEQKLSQKVKLFAPDIVELPEESTSSKRYKVDNINIFISR